MLPLRRRVVLALLAVLLGCEQTFRLPAGCGSSVLAASAVPSGWTPVSHEVVVIPEIGTDHQFNLNYTVAHLMALLDQVHADAVVVYDDPQWIAQGCLAQASDPAAQAVFRYARERKLPFLGLGMAVESFAETRKFIDEYTSTYPGIDDVRDATRARLERETARLAAEFRRPPDLDRLLRDVLPRRTATLPETARNRIAASAERVVNELERVLAVRRYGRIAMVLDPVLATFVETSLRGRTDVALVPVSAFLPLKADAVARHMDFATASWIVAGLVDEWYGMWAPEAFPRELIAERVERLNAMAPDEPVTRFLRARWLMQNGQFAAARPLLVQLAEGPDGARFPFPLAGKWIRPPWRSVRDKARLNLAFVHDYEGARDKALRLYEQLLARGEALNEDARASGYVYDDIRWVIQSYTRQPFTGTRDEAFRHFRLLARVPPCMARVQQPVRGE